jgi:AraC-like DNA-binding protein
MPLFMDVHIVPGVKAMDVAEAHRKDLLHQDSFDCKCMTYWIDEQRENIFCLIEAPNKEAVEEMHNRAHGLVPNKVIEVSSSVVESFLGRIYDPSDAQVTDGMKVFEDPSFRIILLTKITDPVLLQHKYGSDKSGQLLDLHNKIVRKHLAAYGGREVEHDGSGFIASFTLATRAVSCALAIHEEMPAADADALGFRIGINAGEPVENSNNLFGDTLQLATCICEIAKTRQIALASAVKDLVAKDHLHNIKNDFLTLQPQDENLLKLLYTTLEEKWQNPDFDMDNYCKEMAMSKSQLYRKTISLTGLSPNILLKHFRLEKAREMMKKKGYSIAQVTFDSGFTSPSYFTKCFKSKYGLLPLTYLELLL